MANLKIAYKMPCSSLWKLSFTSKQLLPFAYINALSATKQKYKAESD